MTPLNVLSVFVYIMLVIGFVNRRRPRLHVPLMLTAFVIDMGMLAYIELSRDAIEIARRDPSTLMKVHIAFSVTTILLYVGQIVTGIKNVRGRKSRWHSYGGPALMVTRFGNLVTSFLVT